MSKKIINRLFFSKIYDYREYVVIDEKRVFYLINSKAACTSIKVSMYKQNYKDDYSVHNESANIVEVYNGKFLDKKDYFGFTYVRNPFSRLVSCYESKYHEDIHKYGFKYNTYEKYLGGLLKKDKGFNVFLLKILIIPNRMADKHFRSQYKLIYNKDNCTLDYVGKIEEIESYDEIEKKFNFNSLGKYNVSKKVDYRNYYSTLSTLLTYLKYRKDIICFNYIKEYKSLLNYTIKNKKII